MNKAKKIMMLAACAVLLVCISVGATVAYLMDSDTATNTFSVGQVGLSLDEADVDDSTPNKERDTANRYHLMPGKTYVKDPTVHVDANSESCWLFVKVENGIADIEAEGETSIAAQIVANGWTPLTEGGNIYYKAYNKGSTRDYVVFERFKLKGDGLVNGSKPAGYTGNDEFLDEYVTATKGVNIKVTAYAVQLAGFENDPAAAWAAGNWN